MKALLDWIDDRTALGGLLRGCLQARRPGRASLCRAWRAAIALVFCVQVVTGLFIWMYYSPSAHTAWESVYFLQFQVAGGWLLRAMHHFSAQELPVLVGLYLLHIILTGAYRAPRELVFCSAVLMLLVSLGLLLTGDLLAWDQNSLASTQTRLKYLELLPGIGDGLFRLAAGGPQLGHLTLTRFLVLHICCLSGGLALLLVLHAMLVRRADAADAAAAQRGGRLRPSSATRNALATAVVLLAMIVVMGVILLLSVWHGVSGDDRGVELGSPADLSSPFAAARPELAFRALYQLAQLFPGGRMEILPVFVIPAAIVLFILAMPWIARCRGGHLLNLAATAALLIGAGWLSWTSIRTDRQDQEHQAAVQAQRALARRAVQLARSQGIPPIGALTLLRNDPKTQGPILFQANCANCHDHAAGGPHDIRAETPKAPNLHGFADRQWLSGLLDPQQVRGPEYFGNTALSGRMADFVQEVLSELDQLDREDIETIVAVVSADAELRSQRKLDAADARRIADGKTLLDDWSCLTCHRFHQRGTQGNAPDLTGYGSREWIIAITADPASQRFYGEGNDAMPAYAQSLDDPANNILTARDIALLADWLRGEWEE